jgi:pimeloyl-ACP methyl ester carboxylesterase
MGTVTSKDGTTIAFDHYGDGPLLILVGGAFQHRAFDPNTSELARLLSPQLTVIHYDRRGRGESGDTEPYDVKRELEDLEALIAEGRGTASLFGNSSGGNLALTAVLAGLPISKLAVWEANILVNGSRPPLPSDYIAHLRELVAAERRADAVEYFLTTAVAVPEEFVAPMRDMPMWPGFEAVAHTLAYDGAVVGDSMSGEPLDPDRFAGMVTPTLVLDGGQTPWMSSGADALASALPNARRKTLAGQGHDVAPDVLAPALLEFLSS